MKRTDEWCATREFVSIPLKLDMNEQGTGAYQAPGRRVELKDGASLCEIRPRAAAIIGGYGRVDILGRYSSVALIYLKGKGPGISTKAVYDGVTHESPSRPMLKGVDGEDWYWVDARKSTAHRVDEKFFMTLISNVSGHDIE
ncbi:TPA: hypothetical protein QDB31_004825 [Burkholderia vietnamiensis]|nr:hypothetical protein [Burkholderia vietnamiensis]